MASCALQVKCLPGETADTFGLARDLQQPVYAQPAATTGDAARCCGCRCPSTTRASSVGVVLGEYSIDSLLRYGTPPKCWRAMQ